MHAKDHHTHITAERWKAKTLARGQYVMGRPVVSRWHIRKRRVGRYLRNLWSAVLGRTDDW